jgi:uncharacterized membrane protein
MPQASDSRRVMVTVAGAISAVWAATVFLAPGLAGSVPSIGALPYALGALICHQRPERSFHLGGAQLPVCARCTGLYLGAAIGLVTWALLARRSREFWPRRAALLMLAMSALPTAFTVATAWLGLADPANPWRAALAAPLGAIAGGVAGAVMTDHLK